MARIERFEDLVAWQKARALASKEKSSIRQVSVPAVLNLAYPNFTGQS